MLSHNSINQHQILTLHHLFFRLMSDYEVTLVNDNMQGIPDYLSVDGVNTAAFDWLRDHHHFLSLTSLYLTLIFRILCSIQRT